MKLPAELRQTAAVMRAELEASRLCVTLAPCQRGRAGNQIRTVDECNPAWYRQFCLEYPSGRKRGRKKPDTAIKRAGTLRGLAELERGEMHSVYAVRLFPYVVEEYLAAWRPLDLLAVSGEAGQPQPIYL